MRAGGRNGSCPGLPARLLTACACHSCRTCATQASARCWMPAPKASMARAHRDDGPVFRSSVASTLLRALQREIRACGPATVGAPQPAAAMMNRVGMGDSQSGPERSATAGRHTDRTPYRIGRPRRSRTDPGEPPERARSAWIPKHPVPPPRRGGMALHPYRRLGRRSDSVQACPVFVDTFPVLACQVPEDRRRTGRAQPRIHHGVLRSVRRVRREGSPSHYDAWFPLLRRPSPSKQCAQIGRHLERSHHCSVQTAL